MTLDLFMDGLLLLILQQDLNIRIAQVTFIVCHYNIVLGPVSQGKDSFVFVHQNSPLQPMCWPGKKDESCHLLVCTEGEMTFGHRAKCERTVHSSFVSDHCYFSCLSSEVFRWLPPSPCCIKGRQDRSPAFTLTLQI